MNVLKETEIIVSRHESYECNSKETNSDDLRIVKKFLISNKADQLTSSPITFVKLYSYLLDSLLLTHGLDAQRVLVADSLSIWFLRCTQIIKFGAFEESIHQKTSISSLNSIYQYISDFLQNGVGALANALSSLLLKLNTYIRTWPQSNYIPIFHRWIDKTMKLSYTSKNTYFLIDTLVKELPDSSYIFKAHASFPRNCVNIMWSNALANAAGKAFVTIFQKSSIKEISCWVSSWNDIVYDGLLNNNSRKNVLTYLLPLLFNANKNTYHIFTKKNFNFDAENTVLSDTDVELGTEVLMIGLNLGLCPSPFEPNTSKSIIPRNSLLQFLTHKDEKFRLRSFSLLVMSVKGSQVIFNYIFDIIIDLKLIEIFLKESDSIEVRNEFFSSFRQFIVRIKDSLFSVNRDIVKMKKSKKDDESKLNRLNSLINSGYGFLTYLVNLLIDSVKPASTYSQCTLSMSLLQTLIDLGFDGYDRSKQKRSTTKGQRLKESTSIKLPQPIPIFNEELIQLLFNNLTNNYEDIRTDSVTILLECPTEILKTSVGYPQEHSIEIVNKALDILYDLKGRKSEGGARIFQFLAQFYNSIDDYESLFNLFNLLLTKLNNGLDGLKISKEFLKIERVHGIFTALRFILQNVDMKKACASQDIKLISIYEDLIYNQILRVWSLVKKNLLDAAGLDDDDDSGVVDTENRLISTFSWKVVKESTSLLSEILNLNYDARMKKLTISEEVFLHSSDLIMDQLASVNHRGAFSSVYPSFVSVCEICFNVPSLEKYPHDWLLQNTDLIESKHQYISRRSGGLPYLLTGILTGEKKKPDNTKNSELMGTAFTQLFRISSVEYIPNADEVMDIPQVHAFNCIKHIFIDSQLADESVSYVNQALQLALKNFTNETWAIRNCAVMLFTALQNRLFGTKKLGDLLPCIPSRLFFSKYVGVDKMLYDLLRNAVMPTTDCVNAARKIEVVFPILTILSRLECYDDKDVELKPFVDLLLNHCLGISHWKVREMAAKLAAAIIHPMNILPIMMDLLKIRGQLTTRKANIVHGSLLTILEMIERVEKKLPALRIPDSFRLEVYDSVFLFLVDSSRFTWSTAKTYVDILVRFNREESVHLPVDVLNILGNFLVSNLVSNESGEKPNDPRQLFLASIVSLLLEQYLKQSMVDELFDLTLLSLLSIEFFEVQLSAISFFDSKFDIINGNIDCDVLFDDLWQLISNENCWSYVRSHALGLLQKLLSSNVNLCEPKDRIKFAETLFSFTLKEYSGDVNATALDVLGPVLSQIAYDKDLSLQFLEKFLNLCGTFAHESMPFFVRLASTHALTEFSYLSMKNDIKNKYVARALVLLHVSLSDDDEDARGMASESLGVIFDTKQNQVPLIVSESFFELYSKAFEPEICESTLIEYYIHLEPLISDRLIETDLQNDDLLFDVECLNLYRDSITNRSNFNKALINLNARIKLEEKSLKMLKNKVLYDLELIYQFSSKRGIDGYVGWSKDDFVFTAITEAVLDAKTFLNLRPDEDVKVKLSIVMELLESHDLNLSIRRITSSFT